MEKDKSIKQQQYKNAADIEKAKNQSGKPKHSQSDTDKPEQNRKQQQQHHNKPHTDTKEKNPGQKPNESSTSAQGSHGTKSQPTNMPENYKLN